MLSALLVRPTHTCHQTPSPFSASEADAARAAEAPRSAVAEARHERQAERHEGHDEERKGGRRDGERHAEDEPREEQLRDGEGVDAAPGHAPRERRQRGGRRDEVADAREHRVGAQRLVRHEEEQACEDGRRREAEQALQRRGDEGEDEGGLEEGRVALLVRACRGRGGWR